MEAIKRMQKCNEIVVSSRLMVLHETTFFVSFCYHEGAIVQNLQWAITSSGKDKFPVYIFPRGFQKAAIWLHIG